MVWKSDLGIWKLWLKESRVLIVIVRDLDVVLDDLDLVVLLFLSFGLVSMWVRMYYFFDWLVNDVSVISRVEKFMMWLWFLNILIWVIE